MISLTAPARLVMIFTPGLISMGKCVDDFGAIICSYRPSIFKVLVNLGFIGLGIWAAVAMILDGILRIVGVVLLPVLLGLLYIVLHYQIRRSVTFYQNGIEHRMMGKQQRYHYDKLDLYSVAVSGYGGRYDFNPRARLRWIAIYASSQEVMRLGEAIGQVQGILREVDAGFIRHVLPRLKARLDRGETITFDRLTVVQDKANSILHVTNAAIHFGNVPPVPWSAVRGFQVDTERVYSIVRVIHELPQPIEFRTYFSSGSALAVHLMSAVLKEQKAT